MNSWFRFYNQAIRDPKVLRLSDSDFRLWVSLLAVASENDGSIPCLSDLKLLLNRRLDHLSTGIDRLVKASLIDQLEAGYEPHNWTKFQYRSDKSTERVQRFRERNRNSVETPPDSDTDSDTEQSPPTPRQNGGMAGRVEPEGLASELCQVAGIGKSGAAAVGHVRRWLDDGIGEATIRKVVAAMARNGTTRSLKRFDMPIRREHDEKAKPNGVRPYQPSTRDELERAIALAEDRDMPERAVLLRTQLAALVQGAAQALRSQAPR